jgi:tRNA(fMet)-specific endonuclease VapC
VGFEESTAHIFGGIVGDLEKRGQIISDMDALIASVALEHDELVVTRNLAHFQRVAGLRIEGY